MDLMFQSPLVEHIEEGVVEHYVNALLENILNYREAEVAKTAAQTLQAS
jgi:hypothetical protein